MNDNEPIPEAEIFSISDDWGTVGTGWTCSVCGNEHSFVSLDAGETVTCEKCGTEHVSTEGTGAY